MSTEWWNKERQPLEIYQTTRTFITYLRLLKLQHHIDNLVQQMLDIAYKNPLHFSLLEYILFDSLNLKKSTQENVLTKQIQEIIAIKYTKNQ